MERDLTSSRLLDALAAWQGVLGADRVLGAGAAQLRYGPDTTGAVRSIPCALSPYTTQEVQACVEVAATFGVPLHPISTGRNWGYGTALPARSGCAVLDLSGMRRVVDFDRELGVVTLEPGVTQGMLHAYLQEHGGEFMVPTTGAGPDCSLVGNALERGYGITPIADHFAAVTDLQAVRPDGSLYRTTLARLGGEPLARLYKWGLGPYEQGLFTQGRAGVVTQMSIVLARRPECVQMGMFSLAHDELLEEAVLRVRAILRALPGVVGGINLMNQLRVLAMTTPYPVQRCGPDGVLPKSVVDELGRRQQVMPWTGVITLYGTNAMVAAARQEIRQRMRGVGSRLLFISPRRAMQLHHLIETLPAHWLGGRVGKLAASAQALKGALELACGIPNRTAMPLAYWRNPQGMPSSGRSCTPDPAQDGCGLLWYAPLVPMRPTTVREQVEMVNRLLPRHGMEPLITLTSLSERLFDSTVPLLFDRATPMGVERVRAAYEELVNGGKTLGTFPYRAGVDQLPSLGFLDSGDVSTSPISPGRYE